MSEHPARPDVPSIGTRAARIDDAERLAAIERAAFDPRVYDGLITADKFRRFARGGPTGANAALIVAEDREDRVVGYALVLFRRGSSAGRFYSLAVDPAAQGTGVGGRLFAAAEQAVRDHGATRMRLEIRADNHTLEQRYARAGYRHVQRVEGYYPDGCAALRMERRVG
ncbi:MAG: GNAT family N-acetyltransferase [Geminicoccaceae bacterium]|nr:GNAT family N-acetyltransferase [Geminicoccaceae bacterium]